MIDRSRPKAGGLARPRRYPQDAAPPNDQVFFARRDGLESGHAFPVTLIAPASIVTAVCSNCWSMAGYDGARQNRTAKIPSQHDCAVIELGAASGPASVWCPSPVSTAGATIFGPMLRQRCQPIPHSAR
jgi:hypothetical protein